MTRSDRVGRDGRRRGRPGSRRRAHPVGRPAWRGMVGRTRRSRWSTSAPDVVSPRTRAELDATSCGDRGRRRVRRRVPVSVSTDAVFDGEQRRTRGRPRPIRYGAPGGAACGSATRRSPDADRTSSDARPGLGEADRRQPSRRARHAVHRRDPLGHAARGPGGGTGPSGRATGRSAGRMLAPGWSAAGQPGRARGDLRGTIRPGHLAHRTRDLLVDAGTATEGRDAHLPTRGSGAFVRARADWYGLDPWPDVVTR